MATSTANMGLRQWNLPSDHFESTNLSSNWAKVDDHDHTTGKGKQIPTDGIQNGAITAPKLAPGVGDIPDDSLTWQKLSPGAGSLGVGAFHAGQAGGSLLTGQTVLFNAELFDPSNWFDPTTGIWTTGIPGVWDLSWCVLIANTLAVGNYAVAMLTVNGLSGPWGDIVNGPNTNGGISQGRYFYSASAGTQFAVRIQHTNGGSVALGGNAALNRFGARLLYTL